jgi:hypothetical protein
MYRSTFSISTLDGGEWLPSHPSRFIPRERTFCIHRIGGGMGLRAGLGDMKEWTFLTLPGLELRPLSRPARSQSIYRLRSLNSNCIQYRTKIRKKVYGFVSIGRTMIDRLCGLVIRVLGYRSGGPGSIPGTTKKKVVGLERGPLSLVSTTEELLDRKVASPV